MSDQQPKKQLSDEDMERVQQYLESGYNETERQPFHVWRLLLVLWLVVMALGGIALGLGYLTGNIE